MSFRSLPRILGYPPATAFLLLSLGLASLALPVRAQTVTDASEFLISFGQRATKELNDPALGERERASRFRELLREGVDVPAIGRFILGPRWRRATEAERSDFLAAFEEIVLQRFLPMFTGKSDAYKGTHFQIIDTRPVGNSDDQVLLRTRIERPQGPPAELVWRISKTGQIFKILDISVQGLSMALTLREEYGAAIKRLGGVGGLVKVMRQKLQKGAYAPKATGSGR